MTDASHAMAVAISHMDDVKEAFADQSGVLENKAEDALQKLALATKQLDTATRLDPMATALATDGHGAEGQLSQEALRAELLRLEGILHEIMGNPKKAISAIEKSLTHSPENAMIYSALSAAYMSGGDKSKAVRAAKKAVKLDPSSVEYAKELDELEGISTAAIKMATFTGKWWIILLLFVFGLAPFGDILTVGTFEPIGLIATAGFWGAAYGYWRWKRGRRI